MPQEKMQFVLFLLSIWNLSPLASQNIATDHLEFLLGCRAMIHCQHYGSNTKTFSWFNKEDERSDRTQLFFQDKKGLKYHRKSSRPKLEVLHNGTLVIENVTQEHQGLYWCEACNEYTCQKEFKTISVKKEILKETKTIVITEGSSFTHPCSGKLSDLKWTFDASKMTERKNVAQRPDSYFVTSDNSMHIVNVKRADAGNYSCWGNGCHGRRHRLLTVTLCVVTGQSKEDLSNVSCDMEPKSTTATVDTETRVVPFNYSTEQVFDGFSTVNGTNKPSEAFNKRTGELIVICGTSAFLICLVLIAPIICCCRPSLHAGFNKPHCCCELKSTVEEQTSVVYSSVVFRGFHDATQNHMNDSHCVYSEINV